MLERLVEIFPKHPAQPVFWGCVDGASPLSGLALWTNSRGEARLKARFCPPELT